MKKLATMFILSTYLAYGVEYKLQLGLSPYRHTTITDVVTVEKEQGNFGFSIGNEFLWSKKNLSYGMGFEIKNRMEHTKDFFEKNSSYFSSPIYGVINYSLIKDYYLLGRAGVLYTTGELVDNGGIYLGLGAGKKFGNIGMEFLYESSQIKKTGKLIVIEENLKNSGLFFNGALDELSLKVTYSFGKGNPVKPVKNDITEIVQVTEKIENPIVEEKIVKVEEKIQTPIIEEPVKNDKIEDIPIVHVQIADTPILEEKTNEIIPVETEALAIAVVEEVKLVTESPVTIAQELIINTELPKVELIPIVVIPELVVDNKPKETPFVESPKQLISLSIMQGYKTNETKLTKDQKNQVLSIAKNLQGQKGTLYVIGYTDDTGSEKYNLKISQKRADIVSETIKTLLENSKNIVLKPVGRGETDFIVKNSSSKNRKKNIRIEFEFKSE